MIDEIVNKAVVLFLGVYTFYIIVKKTIRIYRQNNQEAEHQNFVNNMNA